MALCLMSMSAMAQEQTQKMRVPKQRPTVEQMAQKRTEMLSKKLDLNEAQAKQVYQLNLESAQSLEKHRAQMKVERLTEAEKMKQILNTDQFMKWSQMQSATPARMHKGGKKGGACCQNGADGRMKTRDCSARNAESRNK